MAKGQLEPTPSEDDLPLPVAKAPNFDLSDETVEHDSNNDLAEEVAEEGVGGEPEGIFDLFDREFPPGERNPIEPSESGEFDREFSESFEEMFEAIRGDDSAPLFEEPRASETASTPELDPTPEPESEHEVEPELEAEPLSEEPVGETEDQLEADSIAVESDPESLEDSLLPIPKPEQNSGPTRDISEELEELTLEDEFALDEELPTIGYEELDPIDLSPEDSPLSFGDADDEDDYENTSSEAAAASWSSDEPLLDDDSLEELNFDDSDDEELYDEDLSGLAVPDASSDDEFEDFAKLALGFDDEDDEEEGIDEEDDFTVEELGTAPELDPFEDISIMSSEDVAKYEPSFGTDELQFKDEEPLPDDPDPFGDGGFSSSSKDEESLEELDPFGDGSSSKESKSATEPKKDEDDFDPNAVNNEEGDGEKSGSGFKLPSLGPIAGILLLPWRLFSTAIDFLFGLLETVLKVLGGIPVIGLPFRVIAGVLSNIPTALKRVLVLVLIVLIFWGGGSLVGNLLPKPSVSISLPDSGGAKFKSVELKDGRITGEIENTGAIVLQVFPRAEVSERKLFEPGTWFKPKKLGSCEGGLVEVPIDGTVKVSYDCKVAVDGKASLKPSLRE